MNHSFPYVPPITGSARTRDNEHLCFGDWPGPDPTLIAIHGLTRHHRFMGGLAAGLKDQNRVIAPDLRGRGNSSKPGAGSYGIERHARDVIDLMDEVGVDRAVVAGHSMGAWVAAAIAAMAPDRVLGLVLLDGGIWVPPPEAAHIEQPDELLEVIAKPQAEGLKKLVPSLEEHLGFWAQTGFFKDDWDDFLEWMLAYEIVPRVDGYALKCSADAAYEDFGDVLSDPTGGVAALDLVRCPILAIGADCGAAGEPVEIPTLRSQLLHESERILRETVSDLTFHRVHDTNHGSIIGSTRGSLATAELISDFTSGLKAATEATAH